VSYRRRGRGACRALIVAVLALAATVPLLSTSASASDIGDAYSPDPLSALAAWAIYGGVVGGGFLIAITITVLSSRQTGPPRYRPGRPWAYDELWIGDGPVAVEGERPRVAVPGAGGASGSW
jgi:hypothetical protein